MFKKIFIVVIAVAMAALLLSRGFFSFESTGNRANEPTAADATVEEGPSTTSKEADLYVYGLVVCNGMGVESTAHSVNETGDIVDANGEVVVAARNVEMFTVADKAELVGELTFEMAGEQVSEDIVLVTPVTIPVEFVITPREVTNSIVTIESVDAVAFEFLSEEPDADPSAVVSVAPNADGKIRLVASCNMEGEHVVLVRNVLGEVIGEFAFRFEVNVPERVEGEEETAESTNTHAHEYEDKVVAPTVLSRGYTIHTCKICGASYTDSYVEKLPHTHEYEEKVVAPTYTAQGYTIHTCKICGDTYKDTYTAVLVCNHEHMKDTVVAPTCTEGGYTLHECQVCKNYSFKDQETPATGHKWDEGKVTTQPTCAKEGVKTFTCTICGEKRAEKIDKVPHQYEEKVVESTYTEKGYTLHTCKICGDSYKDNYTDIKPHEHDYKTRTVAPTCTETGYIEHKCSTCGDIYKTDEKPALGHDYKDTVIEPTQTEKGYTHHECSRCGDSYDDNYVDVLPPWGNISASEAAAAGNAWLSANGYKVEAGCIGGSSYIMTTMYPYNYDFSQASLNEKVVSRAQRTAAAITPKAIDDGYECAVFYCCCEDQGDGVMFIAIYYGYYNYLGEPIVL